MGVTGGPAGPAGTDPYRYFRIEARELVDALAAGLSALRTTSEPTAQVAALLRHAHTLKGAARVVSQTGIADGAHALEDLLGPYRRPPSAVPGPEVAMMLGAVDDIVRLVDAIDAPPAEKPSAPTVPGPRGPERRTSGRRADDRRVPDQRASSDGPASTAPAAPAPLPVTVRADLSELDDVLRGVNRTLGQVAVLRDCGARISGLRDHPDAGDELQVALAGLGRQVAAAGETLERELRQVHDTAERLRLIPVSSIVPDLERAARDVAQAQGKQVSMTTEGGNVRLDVPMTAVVAAALQQIVRNAVAHGIEPAPVRFAAGKPAAGRISLRVEVQAARVVFRCTDDGAGVDLGRVREELLRKGSGEAAGAGREELLELLLAGGVSTAATVTEVSGRGIGLDVVRDAVHRVGGTVRITTEAGAGTTIELRTPLTLTAQELVLVDAGRPAGVPLAAVTEVVRLQAADIVAGPGGATCHHRGRDLPFVHLAAALDDRPPAALDAWSVLVVETPAGAAAVGVAHVLGTAEPAIRPLPTMLPRADLVAGVWLDVDGTPRLVLDPEALVAVAGRPLEVAPSPEHLLPVLVVDDSLTTRMLEQSILEAAGYEVETASSAEEGLAMAARTDYAVALVDVEMPGMDGFGFVQQVRSRPELRRLPCILVTSRASAADRRRGQEVGASGHIDKGQFNQGTLLATISAVTGPAGAAG